MWRFGVAVGSVLALLLPVASISDASSRHSAKCPTSAHVIVADAQAEVYLRPETLEPSGLYSSPGVYGCAYGHQHSYRLGWPYGATATGGGGVRMETVAGQIVAYEVFSASGGEGQAQTVSFMVVVRDLRSGRVLHVVPTGNPLKNPFAVGVGRIVALVVKSDGAVAWIAHAPPYEGTYQVHAADKMGSRTLASGAEVDPSSLALEGRTLYWTQGGKPMYARLN